MAHVLLEDGHEFVAAEFACAGELNVRGCGEDEVGVVEDVTAQEEAGDGEKNESESGGGEKDVAAFFCAWTPPCGAARTEVFIIVGVVERDGFGGVGGIEVFGRPAREAKTRLGRRDGSAFGLGEVVAGELPPFHGTGVSVLSAKL